MKRLVMVSTAAALMGLVEAAGSYPMDGYTTTGIRRLELVRLRVEGRLSGPVPVKGPDGEVPGYVVAATQSTILGLTTLERHFIPGFGMAREVTIMAAGGNLISRQELVLDTERAGSD